jgi:hypothetical protein
MSTDVQRLTPVSRLPPQLLLLLLLLKGIIENQVLSRPFRPSCTFIVSECH